MKASERNSETINLKMRGKKQQNNGAKKQLKTPGEKQTQGEKL